jgi:hypothetical protein
LREKLVVDYKRKSKDVSISFPLPPPLLLIASTLILQQAKKRALHHFQNHGGGQSHRSGPESHRQNGETRGRPQSTPNNYSKGKFGAKKRGGVKHHRKQR